MKRWEKRRRKPKAPPKRRMRRTRVRRAAPRVNDASLHRDGVTPDHIAAVVAAALSKRGGIG